MPIPKTFSAPGEDFDVAIEDSLRYAVWLAHISDNLMARRYAFDSNNLAAGIKIRQTWQEAHREDSGLIALPQCIIVQVFQNSIFEMETAKQGVRRVNIAAYHLVAYDPAYASDDVEDKKKTINQVAQRSDRIFMRGTLYMPEQETNRGMLIDPYRAVRYTAESTEDEDLIGAYDPSGGVPILNDMPPKVVREQPREYARRDVRIEEDLSELRRSGVFALGYPVIAQYEVRISDRETMTSGGSIG